MLINKTFHDVPTKNGGSVRIYIIAPVVPDYPHAKFPGEPLIECSIVDEIEQDPGVVVFR